MITSDLRTKQSSFEDMSASRQLSGYTNVALEILVVALTLAPIIILIFFYHELPAQIPVFLNLRGEVQVWTAKNVMSVFRVPALAVDLQLICLLMKYGTVKSQLNVEEMSAEYQNKITRLTTTFWDFLRLLIAVTIRPPNFLILFLEAYPHCCFFGSRAGYSPGMSQQQECVWQPGTATNFGR